MRLIKRKNLEDMASPYPDVEQVLADWIAMVHAARWTNPDELIRTSTTTARTIKNGRVIFNIKGNKYRLICAVRYAVPNTKSAGILMIKFFGTHNEYDTIDPTTVEP